MDVMLQNLQYAWPVAHWISSQQRKGRLGCPPCPLWNTAPFLGAVDAGGTCIHEVLHTKIASIVRMATNLQDVIETNQVAFYVGIWICDRIPDTRLRCQIDYNGWSVLVEDGCDEILIRNASFDELEG